MPKKFEVGDTIEDIANWNNCRPHIVIRLILEKHFTPYALITVLPRKDLLANLEFNKWGVIPKSKLEKFVSDSQIVPSRGQLHPPSFDKDGWQSPPSSRPWHCLEFLEDIDLFGGGTIKIVHADWRGIGGFDQAFLSVEESEKLKTLLGERELAVTKSTPVVKHLKAATADLIQFAAKEFIGAIRQRDLAKYIHREEWNIKALANGMLVYKYYSERAQPVRNFSLRQIQRCLGSYRKEMSKTKINSISRRS